jgi:tetratricopeptide repeat protein 30
VVQYELGNFKDAKKNLKLINTADFTTLMNQGCVSFKEGEYELALQKFKNSMKITDYNAELSYNIALCYYECNQLDDALKYADEIIQRAYRAYPYL